MKQNKKRFLALILALTVATICVSFPAHAGEAEAAEVSDTQLLNADITTLTTTTGSTFSVQEGIFNICNAELGNYLQIDNDASTSSSGAAMELWDYDAGIDQRWQLVSHYSYYAIVSLASGLALTASSNTDGAAIVQQEYSGLASQLWSFELTDNNTYIIRPATNLSSSSNFCMAAGSGILTTNGRNVKQTEYTDNSDYKDEWILEVPFTYESYIYTDMALISIPAYEIRQYYTDAAAAIFNNFGIYLYAGANINPDDALDLDTTGCRSTSITAICNTSCGADADCSTLHHHAGNRINQLYRVSGRYTYRIINYALCSINSGTHKEVIGVGQVGGTDATTSYLTTPDLTRSIQHELTHNLGCSHAVCDLNTQACVLKGDIGYWCDDCRATIIAYLYD